MSIRLNKALRNLNISLKTATDFLLRHKELGEIREEPSFKLNENQYEALCLEFNNTNRAKIVCACFYPIAKGILIFSISVLVKSHSRKSVGSHSS